jgi:hypothetical protein
VMESAATSTVIRAEDEQYINSTNEPSTKVFYNANGTLSRAGNKATLRYNLRNPANEADMVPSLSMNSLMSTSKLADANYITVFTKEEVQVFDAEAAKFNVEGHVVMKGWRCPITKLWRVPLTPNLSNINTDTGLMSEQATEIIMKQRSNKNEEQLNSVYELPNTEQVIAWYHAAAGYPTKATWIKAIDAGFFATWPLLTSKAVRKHFPEAVETTKGHMRRVKSGVRSTKTQVQEHPEIEEAMIELAKLRTKHRDFYIQIKEASEFAYTDQTGRFPVVSSGGHKYIMVLVEMDGNYIALEPMQSRETSELIRVYNTIIDRLKKQGIQPKHQMLDNEALKAYLEAIESHGIEWQLVPPHNHRRNVAEKAIQTAKGHIIANIMGCDETFPMREWHKLLPQIELTMNMLRASNVRPNISAQNYVHGIHDYNKMPLAPLGCKTQCYAGPDQRASFGAHSMDSWYIGTSPNHYRCHSVFMKETKATRITDTIAFHHKRVTNPTVSAADAITSAAVTLTETLKDNMKEDLTKLDLQELGRLVRIFQEAALKVAEQNACQPRVATTSRVATAPRVQEDREEEHQQQDANTPRVGTRLVDLDEVPPLLRPDGTEAEGPRYMTRNQKRLRGSITTDVMLTVMEMAKPTMNPRQLAARRFPLEFLCEFANASDVRRNWQHAGVQATSEKTQVQRYVDESFW